MNQTKSNYSHSHILWFLVSSLLQSAFYWGLTIYISKTYGIGLLGEYSYALAILTPLTVLGGLQAKSYLLTASKSDIKSQVKFLRFVVPTLLLLIAGLVIFWLEPSLLPLFLPLAIIKWSELWSELAYAFMQLDSGLEQVNTAIFIRYAAAFLCLLAIWKFDTDLKLALGLLALVSCLVAGFDHVRSGLNLVPMKKLDSQQTFLTTLSLSMSALLTALLVNIPRYLLKEYHSLEIVGMFSVLFYYYVIPSMLINYSCQGLLKQMKDLTHRTTFLPLTLISIGLMGVGYFFVLYLFGDDLTSALYGNSPVWDFTLAALIASTFVLGAIASIMHYALMGRNIYHIQLKTNIVSALCTLISGYLLIGQMGLTGAFISFIFGLSVQSIVYIFAFSRLKNE